MLTLPIIYLKQFKVHIANKIQFYFKLDYLILNLSWLIYCSRCLPKRVHKTQLIQNETNMQELSTIWAIELIWFAKTKTVTKTFIYLTHFVFITIHVEN